MVSVVSKGGNYLLNVGPIGERIIPPPSIDILNEAGAWIRQNGESIYGTSALPFPQELPLGFATLKGHLLYLHVFDWPENGILPLTGVRNWVTKAYLLAEKERLLNLKRDRDRRILITLPEEPVDKINSVVVLEITGKPDVDPLVIQEEQDRPALLDYLTSSTRGHVVKRFNRKGETEQFHISKMEGPEDIVEWWVRILTPGHTMFSSPMPLSRDGKTAVMSWNRVEAKFRARSNRQPAGMSTKRRRSDSSTPPRPERQHSGCSLENNWTITSCISNRSSSFPSSHRGLSALSR